MNLVFPDWYESTQGPQISQTIFNIVAAVFPVLAIVLQQFGIAIPFMPGALESVIAAVVFLYFVVRAALGHVHAKEVLQSQIQSLASQIEVAGGTPNLDSRFTGYGR